MKTIILLVFLVLVCSVKTTSNGVERLPVVEILTVDQRIMIAFDTIPDPMKKLLLAQAKHESGNFTNKLTRTANNFMAINHSSNRPTLSLGRNGHAEGRSGFAVYSSLDSAALDFVYFMQYKNIPDTFTRADTYAKFLKKINYYEDSEVNYRRALNRWLKQIE